MKNSILLFALLMIGMIACKKKTTDPIPQNNNNNVSSFTWTENGGAVITADSAYWTTGSWGTGIRAFKGAAMANFFEINWATENNTSVGAKTLNVGSDFTFLQGSAMYTNPAAETLNVTAFASDKLSGNCTVAVSGGAINTLVCTFTNLPKK